MNKVSYLYGCAAAGLRFVVVPSVFVVAEEHEKSKSWNATFGSAADVRRRMTVAALFRRFKQETLEASLATSQSRADPWATLGVIERGAAVAADGRAAAGRRPDIARRRGTAPPYGQVVMKDLYLIFFVKKILDFEKKLRK